MRSYLTTPPSTPPRSLGDSPCAIRYEPRPIYGYASYSIPSLPFTDSLRSTASFSADSTPASSPPSSPRTSHALALLAGAALRPRPEFCVADVHAPLAALARDPALDVDALVARGWLPAGPPAPWYAALDWSLPQGEPFPDPEPIVTDREEEYAPASVRRHARRKSGTPYRPYADPPPRAAAEDVEMADASPLPPGTWAAYTARAPQPGWAWAPPATITCPAAGCAASFVRSAGEDVHAHKAAVHAHLAAHAAHDARCCVAGCAARAEPGRARMKHLADHARLHTVRCMACARACIRDDAQNVARHVGKCAPARYALNLAEEPVQRAKAVRHGVA
jgi:hypothetical protein